MRRLNLTVVLGIFLLFFTACEKQTDEFSGLNGNIFILKIDRVLNTADVQLPSDELQEADYTLTSEYIQYNVTFSKDGQTVTIEPGSIRGEKINDDKGSKVYELVEGVFAGGRFVIWINNEDFEAEHTIYGSGVPIIKSERGNLEF